MLKLTASAIFSEGQRTALLRNKLRRSFFDSESK